MLPATLEPSTSPIYYSYMNPSLEITESQWAVSIVVENKFLSLHTLLIIETLQKNERINFKAHLMGPGSSGEFKEHRAAFKDLNSPYYCYGNVPKVDIVRIRSMIDLSRYRPNYETWSVDRERVQNLMHRIEEEKAHPETLTRPFHIFGENSIFAPKKVVFDIDDEELLKMRQEEPNKFMKLYTFFEERKGFQAAAIDDWNTSMKYPFLKVMQVIAKPFFKSIDDGIKKESLGQILGTMSAYVVIVLPIHLVLAFPAMAIDAPRMIAKNKKMEENYQQQLKLFENHVTKVKVASQNCFNWARCKLATIDIKVEEKPSEWFTPIPTDYFPNQEKQN
jgi:hypothetical protein